MVDSVSLFKLEFQALVLSCCCVTHGMDQISNHTSVFAAQRNGSFYHSRNKCTLTFHKFPVLHSAQFWHGNVSSCRELWIQWGNSLLLFHILNHFTKTRVMNCLPKVQDVLWHSDLRPIQRLKTSLAATGLWWIISWNSIWDNINKFFYLEPTLLPLKWTPMSQSLEISQLQPYWWQLYLRSFNFPP